MILQSPDDRAALRERVLWRMLYETAARAEEVLTLDIPDLDLGFRRAVTRSKGGDREYLHWVTATARVTGLKRRARRVDYGWWQHLGVLQACRPGAQGGRLDAW